MSEHNDWNQKVIDEFRANDGKVGGMFEGAPLLLLHNFNTEILPAPRPLTAAAEWRSGVVRRVAVYIVLSAMFTMVMVNYSMRHGRLAVGPTDDDCNYMVDALQRLSILDHSPKQFVHNLVQFPPHSPFSSGLAVIAFLVFGPHQWAPYVGNGLVLLLMLLIIDWLTARSGTQARIASVIFAFAFPFTGNVITEFRPDCAVGIVTALGIVLLMQRSPVSAGAKNALVCGQLLAAALLIKPTFAPFTLATFAAGWLISALFVHRKDPGVHLSSAHLLRQLSWFALPSIVIALPYYLIHFEVVTYIKNQAFGRNKNAFELKESGMQMLRYYWDGAGGQMMLGRARYVVVVLALGVLVLLWKSAIQNWRWIGGYIAVIAITFTIPTVTRMANPFFAATGDVLILFSAAILIAALFTAARAGFGDSRMLRFAGWGAAAVCVVAFQWPPGHYEKNSEWAQTVNRLGDQLYHTIRDYPGSRNARVFFTAPGAADDMLLRYHALVDNLKFWAPNRHLSVKPEIFHREIDAADFVVASEPESGVAYENIISLDLENDLLEMVRNDTRFTELAKFPALNGKFFHLFVRNDLAARAATPRQVPFEDPWVALYGHE